MSRTKLHGQNYILKDGKRAASVTTIINNQLGWNKNTLIAWAKRITAQGDDADEVMREAGHIGTLCHLMIQGYLDGFNVDTRDYSPNQEEQALKAFMGFRNWFDKANFKALKNEFALVNEELRAGGTVDCIGKIDDDLVLVDWKTSKGGPYPEMMVQLGAYTMMFEAAQPKAKIAYGVIMRFGKEDGKFHKHVISREKLDVGAQVFRHCCALYSLRRQL
ncbi:PD-(D/E)XK nuclease family protein [bacterium]|nr:PD-(D/E)XK nuclease family protein [bacterium]